MFTENPEAIMIDLVLIFLIFDKAAVNMALGLFIASGLDKKAKITSALSISY